MKRFREKIVVITGAGSDIGRATASRFAQEGANVVLVGQDAASLETTAREFPQDRTWIHTDNYLLITCNLGVPSQAQEMLKRVIEKFGKLEVLVNCTNEDLSNNMVKQSAEETNALIETKSEQAAYLCQIAMPYLANSKGNIINISPFPNRRDEANHWDITAYQTVKEKVSALTRKLALDYGAEGVRVNAVNPIISVKTDNLENDNKTTDANALPQQCLKGGFATPSDVAAAITFLASDDAAMITGVNLPVDGGSSISALNYGHS